MTPFFFGDSEFPLYGVHSEPAPAADRAEGVLLFYPLGKEYMRAHWAFRQLSDLLTARGYHVLRFDYSCTGDSAGDAEEASWDRWLDDATTAMEELRDISGVRKVSFAALRAGAAIAAEASVSLKPAKLVLWDPVLSGPEYFKDLESASFVESFDFGGNILARLRAFRLDEALESCGKTVSTSLVHTSNSPEYSEMARSLSSKGLRIATNYTPDQSGWADPAAWESRLRVAPVLSAIVQEVGGEK